MIMTATVDHTTAILVTVGSGGDMADVTLLKHADGEAYTLVEERKNGRVRTWHARRGEERKVNRWITVDRDSINAPNGERHVERLFVLTTRGGTTTVHQPGYERPARKSFMDNKYDETGIPGVMSWCRERTRDPGEPKVTRVRYRVTRRLLDLFDSARLLVVEVDVDADGDWTGRGEMQELVPVDE